MNRIWILVLASLLVLGVTRVGAQALGGGTPDGKWATQSAAVSGGGGNTEAGWNVLAPLASGLGLVWLTSELGLGEGAAQGLLLGIAASLLWLGMRMFRRQASVTPLQVNAAAPGMGDAAQMPRGYSPQNVGNDASARPWENSSNAAVIGSTSGLHSTARNVPDDFDIAAFLQASKANFVSLQHAWDRSDIPSLRAMMTDTMLADIQAQLVERERSGSPDNTTEVVMLEARLLGIEEGHSGHIASVEFSGLIREDPSAGPNPFREVWSIIRPHSTAGEWLVAGVQALQ